MEGALCAKLFKFIFHCVILIISFLNILWGHFCGLINLNIAVKCLVWWDKLFNLNSCFLSLDIVRKDL